MVVFLEKEKGARVSNFSCGTLRCRIWFYLSAFVKGWYQIVSFRYFRFSIQHFYMSVADTSVDFI